MQEPFCNCIDLKERKGILILISRTKDFIASVMKETKSCASLVQISFDGFPSVLHMFGFN
jgi:hypothetical protein